eukprot:COSAG02_NODE_2532_length_8593_cov_2.538969_8_plen_185_part_00
MRSNETASKVWCGQVRPTLGHFVQPPIDLFKLVRASLFRTRPRHYSYQRNRRHDSYKAHVRRCAGSVLDLPLKPRGGRLNAGTTLCGPGTRRKGSTGCDRNMPAAPGCVLQREFHPSSTAVGHSFSFLRRELLGAAVRSRCPASVASARCWFRRCTGAGAGSAVRSDRPATAFIFDTCSIIPFE